MLQKLKSSPRWLWVGLALIIGPLAFVSAYLSFSKVTLVDHLRQKTLESHSSRLYSAQREFQHFIDRVLTTSRHVLTTFQYETGSLSPIGQKLFKEDSSMLGLQIWNAKAKITLYQIEKRASIFRQDLADLQWGKDEIHLRALSDQIFLVAQRHTSSTGQPLITQAAFYLPGLFKHIIQFPNLILMNSKKILMSHPSPLDDSNLVRLSTGHHLQVPTSSGNLVVTVRNLAHSDLKIAAVTPESEILSHVHLFYSRITWLTALLLILFGGLSVRSFMIYARSRTESVLSSQLPESLGKSIKNMCDRVSQLDQVVTESLHAAEVALVKAKTEANSKPIAPPAIAHHSQSYEEMDVHALQIGSHHFGRIWWHSFSEDNDLYLAMAELPTTLTSADGALLAAASRTVLSRRPLPAQLKSLIKDWNVSLAACFQGATPISAQLLKVHLETGQGRLISMGAHPPLQIIPSRRQLFLSPLTLINNRAMGYASPIDLIEHSFEVKPGCALILQTHNPQAALVHQNLATSLHLDQNPYGATGLANAYIAAMGEHLTSDSTVIVLRRKNLSVPFKVQFKSSALNLSSLTSPQKTNLRPSHEKLFSQIEPDYIPKLPSVPHDLI